MKGEITDIEACLVLAKKHIHLNTVSMLYLDEFEEMVKFKNPNPAYKTLKRRILKALNKCHDLGYCRKSYIGTSMYQSGDCFGGRNCLSFDFTKFILTTPESNKR